MMTGEMLFGSVESSYANLAMFVAIMAAMLVPAWAIARRIRIKYHR